MPNRRWIPALLGVLLVLASCGPNIRPVEYRLPGLVAGPVDRGTIKDARKDYGAVFRGTLDHINQTGGMWGDYRKYIELDDDVTASLPDLKPARILVVAGIFSECLEASGVKAFLDAKRHFDAEHTDVVKVDYVSVAGLGTSANNADEIRKYVASHPGDPFVALGYSKGAGDWMQAIATYPEVKRQVRALITIAGAVGGSRLPDLFGDKLIGWVQNTLHDTGLPGCHVADGGGLTSLSRLDRQTFLRSYPAGVVPTYSVAAVASWDQKAKNGEKERTISKVLVAPWSTLRSYSLDEDSQVIAEDAVVPGGTFVAIARADHWAVALPFEETTDPEARRRALESVDRNAYPRAALLEAILRMIGS
jgi:hypothetical protein